MKLAIFFTALLTVAIALAAPVDDFVNSITPSSFTVVFEGTAPVDIQLVIKQFLNDFGIKKTAIAGKEHVSMPNLIVIGDPSKNIVMKSLGIQPGLSVKGSNLFIAASNSAELKSLVAKLPAVKAVPSSVPPAPKQPSVNNAPSAPKSLPASNLVGKAASVSFFGNPLFIGALVFILIVPIAGLVVAMRIKSAAQAGSSDNSSMQLADYLHSYLQMGYSKEQIMQDIVPRLVQSGWDQSMVNDVLGRL